MSISYATFHTVRTDPQDRQRSDLVDSICVADSIRTLLLFSTPIKIRASFYRACELCSFLYDCLLHKFLLNYLSLLLQLITSLFNMLDYEPFSVRFTKCNGMVPYKSLKIYICQLWLVKFRMAQFQEQL